MEPSDSFERVYHGYYGYPHYWNNSGLWGTGNHAGLLADNDWNDLPLEVIEAPGDIHLHSAKEVRGYHIQGSDDKIGHIEDFIVEDSTWAIRYLVVDTSNWWFGKKVLVAPSWAKRRESFTSAAQIINEIPTGTPPAANAVVDVTPHNHTTPNTVNVIPPRAIGHSARGSALDVLQFAGHDAVRAPRVQILPEATPLRNVRHPGPVPQFVVRPRTHSLGTIPWSEFVHSARAPEAPRRRGVHRRSRPMQAPELLSLRDGGAKRAVTPKD